MVRGNKGMKKHKRSILPMSETFDDIWKAVFWLHDIHRRLKEKGIYRYRIRIKVESE